MSSDEAPDIRPEDALDVAQRACARISELEDAVDQLQEDRDDLRDRIVSIELRISEFNDDRAYTDLSREDKIGMVRQFAFEKAANGRGRAVDYNNIQTFFK